MIKPMLAKVGDTKLFKEKNLVFEPKLDGTRAVCYINSNQKLINRRNLNITYRYPEIKVKIKEKSAVLDGEIIVYDKKKIPIFNLLQRREQVKDKTLIKKRSKELPATFVVFDILELNEKYLIKLPFIERRKILEKTLIENKNVELISQTTKGEKLWKKIKEKNMEGVMAKDINGIYHPNKRTRDWQKIKFTKSMDCVIVCYTQEKRELSTLGLAVYNKNNLHWVGKVGTGFSEAEQDQILKQLEKIKSETPTIKDSKIKNLIWVKPKLCCEAKYLELTNDKIMRAPVFLRMRYDKNPKDCKLNQE
jgi:DNA ligase D-like protein (predicted ligase)